MVHAETDKIYILRLFSLALAFLLFFSVPFSARAASNVDLNRITVYVPSDGTVYFNNSNTLYFSRAFTGYCMFNTGARLTVSIPGYFDFNGDFYLEVDGVRYYSLFTKKAATATSLSSVFIFDLYFYFAVDLQNIDCVSFGYEGSLTGIGDSSSWADIKSYVSIDLTDPLILSPSMYNLLNSVDSLVRSGFLTLSGKLDTISSDIRNLRDNVGTWLNSVNSTAHSDSVNILDKLASISSSIINSSSLSSSGFGTINGTLKDGNDLHGETNNLLEEGNRLQEQGNQISQQGNELQQQGNQLEQKQNELLEEGNQLQEEQNETSKGILATLREFFGGFFDNLGKTVMSWIVPTSEQLTEFLNEVNTWFSDRLGFIWYPFSFAIDMVAALAGGSADQIFHIPALSLNILGESYTVWGDIDVDLDAFGIFVYVRTFTSFMLVSGIVRMAINKWDEWIGGHNT